MIKFRYTNFKGLIVDELRDKPDGMTWRDLKERLELPYKTPCPEWVKRMEAEDGLKRVKGRKLG
ncbi:hypothetical protein ACFLQV_01565 [Calditrichota bacterium]